MNQKYIFMKNNTSNTIFNYKQAILPLLYVLEQLPT